MSEEPISAQPEDNSKAAEKVRSFPQKPGIYLMKDAAGRVLYVGKAKNLRARAGSYFLKAAAEDQRTATACAARSATSTILEAESEVDALLMEARLIKDILPKIQPGLARRQDVSVLGNPHATRTIPRVEITRTAERAGHETLWAVHQSCEGLRGALQVLQKIFRFRTCSAWRSSEDDPRWRWFRPCLLASIHRCTAPCNLRISKDAYRKDIHRLQKFLEGKKHSLLDEMRREMATASKELQFEEAARLRDEIHLLETLNERGDLEKNVQPEVFPIDPKRGIAGLQKVLHLTGTPRTIEGIDIAHTAGTETVASVVQFMDGLPFKPGYRRLRIRTVEGVDDFASIHEAVSRRFERITESEVVPDILLIDGGKGQLHAALSALADKAHRPPTVLSLAKREELVFVAGMDEPLRLSRHSYALRLLQYVRDEAHRFAQHYHHILRRRSTLGE